MSTERTGLPWSGAGWKSREGKEILRQTGRASRDFGLIEPDDRILVAVSGGKDSFSLAWALSRIHLRAPFPFSLEFVTVDPGFEGFEGGKVVEFLQNQGLPADLLKENIATVCRTKFGADGDACWLCARLRRGSLYEQARRRGCNKLALGHHADDIIETALINQFFTGQLKAMPPKLRSDDGSVVVIRPLAYLFEDTLGAFARHMGFFLADCHCPYKSKRDESERALAKQLLLDLEKRIPDVKTNLLASLTRVRPSHLLDRTLFDFGDGKPKT